MPRTLNQIYSNFSNDSLKAGYVMAFEERGASEILNIWNWDSFQGDAHKFNVQKSLPKTPSTRDPFDINTAPPSEDAETHLIRLYQAQMYRNFNVPAAAQNRMVDTNDQAAVKAQENAQSMYTEYMFQKFHGDGSFQENTMNSTSGSRNNLCGLDWWLDMYAGHYMGGSFTEGTYYVRDFKGQKVFGTSTYTPSADDAEREVLSYHMWDDAKSLIKGPIGQLVIVTDRQSWLRAVKTLRAEGGNTMSMQMGEERITTYQGYDNTPVIVSDTIGKPKEAYDADVSGTTLTVNGAFIGFGDIDVGRVVRIEGADFSGAAGHGDETDEQGRPLDDDQTKIAAWTGRDEATLKHAAAAPVTGAELTSNRVHVTYVLNMNGRNPIKTVYPASNEANPDTYGVALEGEYDGSIAGFDVGRIGREAGKGATNFYYAQFDGNVCVEDPFSVSRVSGYKLR